MRQEVGTERWVRAVVGHESSHSQVPWGDTEWLLEIHLRGAAGWPELQGAGGWASSFPQLAQGVLEAWERQRHLLRQGFAGQKGAGRPGNGGGPLGSDWPAAPAGRGLAEVGGVKTREEGRGLRKPGSRD